MEEKYSDIACNWSVHNYTCNEWIDKPGTAHVNLIEEEKVIRVVSGELELTVNGISEKLYEGNERIIRAGVVHSIINNSEEDAIWLYGYRKIETVYSAKEMSFGDRIKKIFVAPVKESRDAKKQKR